MRILPILLTLALAAVPARPDDPASPSSRAEDADEARPRDPTAGDEPQDEDDGFKPVEWGPKGLDIRSRDGNYHAHVD